MQTLLTQYDRLRYRLLPYIYSVAWKTTHENYTPMRALVMDFRDDPRVWNIGDQFLFGPSLLVNPVTEPGAISRHLYLPKAKWYNFWTGEAVEGGRAIDASAPLHEIPVFVRAGTILPLGAPIEFTQQANDPIELRIYTGADGDFTLYEDDGDTYNYEKGGYATITFHWDDALRRLTIADRKGQFSGMSVSHTFRIVVVARNHGVGVEPVAAPEQVIEYAGSGVAAKFRE
jgi:alpha-D-xyloside xylohydrolase